MFLFFLNSKRSPLWEVGKEKLKSKKLESWKVGKAKLKVKSKTNSP
jgi:hypothetical protein